MIRKKGGGGGGGVVSWYPFKIRIRCPFPKVEELQ